MQGLGIGSNLLQSSRWVTLARQPAVPPAHLLSGSGGPSGGLSGSGSGSPSGGLFGGILGSAAAAAGQGQAKAVDGGKTSGAASGYLERLRAGGEADREVRDAASRGVEAVAKALRLMVLWVALYAADRAWQAWYTRRMLARSEDSTGLTAAGGDEPCPPPLWGIVLAALAIDLAVMLLFAALLATLMRAFKTDKNAFVIDAPLLRRVAGQYALATAVLLALGVSLGAAAQSKRNFRYREDGLRGIRAFSTLLLLLAFVVVPCA